MRHPFPLRLTIPVTAFCFGVIFGTLYVLDDIQSTDRLVTATSQRHLESFGPLVAVSLSQILANSDSKVLQWRFSQLNDEANLLIGVGVDANLRVLKTKDGTVTDLASLEAVSPPAPELLRRSMATHTAILEVLGGRQLAGAFPFLLSPSLENPGPNQWGAVLLIYDLQTPKSQVFSQIIPRVVILASTLVLLILAFWAYLNHILTHRAGRLLAAFESLTSGNLASRASLGGSDELASLAASFNTMAARFEALTQTDKIRADTYQNQVDEAAEGIFITDREGQIVSTNPAGATMVGYSAEAIIGRPFTEFLGVAELSDHPPQLAEVYQGKTVTSERTIVRKDGTTFAAEISTRLLSDGRLQGIVRDISRYKKAEIVLQEREARMLMAQSLAQFGTWEWDMISDVTTWSDQMLKIYGISRAEFTGKGTDYLNFTHPDDRQRQLTNIQKDFKTAEVAYSESGSTIDARIESKSFRIVRRDGSIRWVIGDAVEIVDANGKATRMVGFLQDITEAREAEAQLRDSQATFAALFQLNPTPMVITRLKDAVVLEANRSFEKLFGYTIAEVVGTTSLSLGFWNNAKDRETAAAMLQQDQRLQGLEAQFRAKDGRLIVCQYSAELLSITNETCAITSFLDLREIKSYETRLRNSLTEKETLLRELHHRTKNNMQIVIALLDMQMSKTADQEIALALNETKNRVYSMALIHQKLYETKNITTINLKDYITDLLPLLVDSYRLSDGQITTKLDLVDLEVGIDTAIPVGLVLNELISNALKYAFPNHRHGRLSVGLEVTKGQQVGITVADDGVGLDPGFDFRRDGKLGITNVYAIVERQLKGRVVFDLAKGVRCTIEFSKETEP